MLNLNISSRYQKFYQLIYIIIFSGLVSCGGGGGGSGSAAVPANIAISSFTTHASSGSGTSSSPYVIIIGNNSELAQITLTYTNTSSINSSFYVILPDFDAGQDHYTLNTGATTCSTSSSNPTSLAPQASCNLVISPSTIGANRLYQAPTISSNGFIAQPLINGSSSFFVNFGTSLNIYIGGDNNILYNCTQFTCNSQAAAFSNTGNGVFITKNNSNILYIGVDSSIYYLSESTIHSIATNITTISGDSIQTITALESLAIIGTNAGIISQCSTTSCSQLANLSSNNLKLFQIATINNTIYALARANTTGNSVIYSNSNNWASPVLTILESTASIGSMQIKNSSTIYLGGQKGENSGIIYLWNGISSSPSPFDSNIGGGDVKLMQLTEDNDSLYVSAASNTYKCLTTSATTDCISEAITGITSYSSTSFLTNVYFGGYNGLLYSSIIGWDDPFIKVTPLNIIHGNITSVTVNSTPF